MSKLVRKYRALKLMVGERVMLLLHGSVAVGLFWFLIETSFVYVFQAFLRGIGLFERSSTMLPEWFPESFALSVGLLVLFGVVRAISLGLKTHLSQVISQEFQREQREKIVDYIFNDGPDAATSEIWTLFSTVVYHSSMVIMNAASLIVTLASAGLFFVFGLVIAPVEMVCGTILLAMGIIPLQLVQKRFVDYGNKLLKASVTVNNILTAGIRNLFLLRIYNLTESEAKKGREALSLQRALFVKHSFFSSFGAALPTLLGVIIISIVSVISHYGTQTPAHVLISFFYIFLRLAQSASEAKATYDQMILHLPNIRRLGEWKREIEFHKKQEREHVAHTIEDNDLFIRSIQDAGIIIEAKNLSFGYCGRDLLFKGLNFKVSPGEVLVIKGESGVGKSTLIQALLGLLKPVTGTATINGLDSELALSRVSEYLGYVGPDPYLIKGTIRENLLYGLGNYKDLSDEDLLCALERANLGELIASLPGGLDYGLQESAQVSTGQKQRIAIARALLRRPKLLIFDEATANLDFESESKIIEVMESIRSGMTMVIVTHKHTFDALANQIICLERNVDFELQKAPNKVSACESKIDYEVK